MIEKNKRTRLASYALLVNEGKILLCRLSAQLPHSVGKWTLPGGGLEFGESPEQAVEREVYEETGLEIRVGALATIQSEVFEQPHESVHLIRFLYRAQVIGGSLVNEADGSTDLAQWLTRAEADRMPLVEVARTGLDLALPRK